MVVPSYNGRALLTECLEGLRGQTHVPLEVIVVDDGSTDGSAEAVRKSFPQVRVLRMPENRGFCAAANAGIAAARGSYVALINNDAVPSSEWLGALVRVMESDPRIAACASKLLTQDDPPRLESAGDLYRPWRSPRARGAGRPKDEFDLPGPVFGACAAAAIYRAEALEDVGLFDESLGSYYEDVELCFRFHLGGWKVWYAPTAIVRHRGHGTAATEDVLFRVLRNDILVYFKDMPTSLLVGCFPALAARQGYQLLYYAVRGSFGLCWRAKRDACRLLPTFVRKRRQVARIRRVSGWELLGTFFGS